MHKAQIKHGAQMVKAQSLNIHKAQGGGPYRSLEERTTRYAGEIILFCKDLPSGSINNELVKQIVRSSGSIGANYREANEAISRKEFIYRIRISRKEAKETNHWLTLIEVANPGFAKRMEALHNESREFRKIFSAMLEKSSGKA